MKVGRGWGEEGEQDVSTQIRFCGSRKIRSFGNVMSDERENRGRVGFIAGERG